MIADLLAYGTKVAVLLGLAAWALERTLAWRRLPRRGLWAAALVLSLTLPAVAVLTPKRAPPAAAVATRAPLAPAATSGAGTHAVGAPGAARDRGPEASPRQSPPRWPARATLDRALGTAWWAASAVLVTLYALLWLRLRIAARHWRRERIDGQPVWVTDTLGPAVCGFLRPVILLPRWALDAPSATRAVILAHEQEHIAARDPALLLLGLLVVVVAPWSLPLWWQLRRLRFAIEVDCDARVLRRGTEPRAYGEVLLAIGERRTFAPVAAIALTEPASQLQRRIRIMTARLPSRGNWAIAATIGVALACLAGAAEVAAPTLRAVRLATDTRVDALRKLPVGEDPRPAAVRAIVRATYPELFGAAAAPTPVLVTLLINPDGTLYNSFKESIEPTPWIPNSLAAFDAMGVDFAHHGAGVKLRMEGSPAARNRVDVRGWYLKPVADPSRDVATVRARVRARYASLLRSPTGNRADVVTVFMTESGDIDRATVATATDNELPTLATPEHFVAMGIPVDRIGPFGTTVLYVGHFTDDTNLKRLQVVFAWPRRPNEPAPRAEEPEQPAAEGPNDDPAVNRLIAEHYFPDLYTHPKEWPRADPWVLLDRQGKVLTVGRRVVMSQRDVQLYVESMYPGIRIDGIQGAGIHGDHGQAADVLFLWLAQDSPVTDPSRADLSKRRDLLLYADVIGEGRTRSSELLALNFGSTGTTACALKNPFGVVHVELTATASGADEVEVRARIQHAPLGTADEIPGAIASAWSPESPPVRVRYGGSAEVRMTDQNHHAWTIALHPDRLKDAGS